MSEKGIRESEVFLQIIGFLYKAGLLGKIRHINREPWGVDIVISRSLAKEIMYIGVRREGIETDIFLKKDNKTRKIMHEYPAMEAVEIIIMEFINFKLPYETKT